MLARGMTGWLVAAAYALAGARRRVVGRLKAGWRLPVVVHALPPARLEGILSWLGRNGVLDSLWLTFDDGWATLAESVPILEKYNVHALVFIAPGQTLRGNVWTEEAMRLGVPAEVWRSWYPLPEAERNARLAGAAARATRRGPGRSLLSAEDIASLSGHPLLSVENHTWSHLSAPHRPAGEVAGEIERAQETLAEWTGRRPKWLAWPFGRGTPELDAVAAGFGLKTLYTRKGYEIGPCRNMALEGVTFQENLGRVLGAWPRVGETL
ncbi:MAG: polysaccharide deacetylase family protein [Kiritimatiellae bacterium]|nr:polysaccharide deacetylase family protein [Kiritimatiellia bacterium]